MLVLDVGLAGSAWPAGGTLISADPIDGGGFIALISVARGAAVVRVNAEHREHQVLWSIPGLEGLETPCNTACKATPLAFDHVRASDDGQRWITDVSGHQVRSDGVFAPSSPDLKAHLLDATGAFLPPASDGQGLDTQGRVVFWDGAQADYHWPQNSQRLFVRTAGAPLEVFTFAGVLQVDVGHAKDFLPTRVAVTPAPIGQTSDGAYWTYTILNLRDDGGPQLLSNKSGKHVTRGLYVHR